MVIFAAKGVGAGPHAEPAVESARSLGQVKQKSFILGLEKLIATWFSRNDRRNFYVSPHHTYYQRHRRLSKQCDVQFQARSLPVGYKVSRKPNEEAPETQMGRTWNTCMPSLPIIPTPILAALIMATSLAPSPIPRQQLPAMRKVGSGQQHEVWARTRIRDRKIMVLMRMRFKGFEARDRGKLVDKSKSYKEVGFT
eukprot:6209747-Pleurochrysis_carterae.AAC.2